MLFIKDDKNGFLGWGGGTDGLIDETSGACLNDDMSFDENVGNEVVLLTTGTGLLTTGTGEELFSLVFLEDIAE